MKKRLDASNLIKAPSSEENVNTNTERRSRQPRMAGNRVAYNELTNSFSLPLPVSKSDVTATMVEVAPEKCHVSTENKRIQSLLKDDDPKIVQLMDSISNHKQRDPVLIRPHPDLEGEFELVYGSRRRFSVLKLNQQRDASAQLKLKAWLCDIPDIDISALADSENDDRVDISIYERAIYYSKLKAQGMDNETIAALNKVGLTTVKYGLQISTIDTNLIALLKSPSDLSKNQGLQIVRLLRSINPEDLARIVNQNLVFHSPNELIKTLKSLTIDSSPPIYFDPIDYKCPETNRLKAQLSINKKDSNRFRLDMFQLSDDQLNRLRRFLAEDLFVEKTDSD